ncbi:hypothetical protein HAX54_005920 [Datura stramonium]|uniref:Uncharacterized protein n=1 Tax=Datura stramonium TaxID=4076 RepID=A0ABS8TAW0_DATST|nr:hypothetical protein [Datura stramonium]
MNYHGYGRGNSGRSDYGGSSNNQQCYGRDNSSIRTDQVMPPSVLPAQRRSQRGRKAPLWMKDYVATAHFKDLTSKPLYAIDQYLGYDHISDHY